MLLSTYLSLTLLLDVAQTRTLFISANGRSEIAYSGAFCAALGAKALVLVLEEVIRVSGKARRSEFKRQY